MALVVNFLEAWKEAFLFLSTMYYETFQTYRKIEELHMNTCFTYHLDSVINILLYLFNHVSAEKF